MASDGHDSAVVRRMVTIVNQKGLHARAAAKLVKTASSFDAELKVVKNGSVVNGRSIMGLMMLAAATGTTIEVRASGHQAEDAVTAVVALVTDGFGEE